MRDRRCVLKIDGERVLELRLENMLTQEELAEVAGVSVLTVHNAEHGKEVLLRTVRVLAKALGVEPRELLPKGKKRRLTQAQLDEADRKLQDPPAREVHRPRPVATITESVGELPLVRWYVPVEERIEHRAILAERFPDGFREAEAEPEEESKRGARVETVLVV